MFVSRVEFKNFGPYRHKTFKLSEGLIGIFGPNGAGKSTLVDGIYAALTGDFSRFSGVKSDCVCVSASPDDPSYIKVEANHAGVTFTIMRSLQNPVKNVLYLGDKKITNTKEIERILVEALGISKRLIDTYVFVPQWSMFSFLGQTDAERAKSFQHICGTLKAEQLWKLLGDKTSEDQQISILDNSVELQARFRTVSKEIKTLEETLANKTRFLLTREVEAEIEKTLQEARERKRLEEDLVEQSSELLKVESAVKDKQLIVEALEVEIEEAASNVDRLREEAEQASPALVQWQRFLDFEKASSTLNDNLERLHAETFDTVEPPDNATELDRLKDLRLSQSKALSEARKHLEEFEKSGVTACPTCKTPVSSLSEQLELWGEVVTETPSKLKALESEISQIEDYLDTAAEISSAKAKNASSIAAVEEALSCLDIVCPPNENLKELESKIEAYEKARKDHLSRTNELSAPSNVLSALIATQKSEQSRSLKLAKAIAKIPEHADEDLEKLQKSLELHRKAEIECASLASTLRGAEQTKKRVEQDLQALEEVKAKQQKLKKLAQLMESVRNVFHRDQLPKIVSQDYLESMEDAINQTLDDFGNPFRIEVADNLQLMAILPGQPAISAARLSGGQKVVLAIAFRWAVNKLLGEGVGMLVLDEPAAGLDEDNLKYLGNALTRFARENKGRGVQVLVISHEVSLQKSFDQILQLTPSLAV